MIAQEELSRLYRDTVLDHSRNPRNFHRIDSPDRSATGYNPLCGDQVTIYVDLNADEQVRDVAFEGTGCAISLASASMLTELVKGRALADIGDLITAACATFSDHPSGTPPGDLAALAGVRAYPSRIRCATLPWRTLEAALRGNANSVSTE